MGLRETAAADNRAILEDSAGGFGWPVTVRDSSGLEASLVGFSGDISQAIDVETGQLVSGRQAHVTLSLATLAAAGLGVPSGVAERDRRPWVVKFNDIAGESHTFKVSDARPDRTIGCVVCTLEAYRDG